MKFLDKRLWATVQRDWTTAREIRIATYNLSVDTLMLLARKAPHVPIRVIFNHSTQPDCNEHQWNDFKEEFGGRVKIHRKKYDTRLHAKVLRVSGDCEFAIVGSSNLTKSGYGTSKEGEGNQEASIRVSDPSELKAIDRWWDTLWEDTCEYNYVHLWENLNPDRQAVSPGGKPSDDDDTLQTAPDNLTALAERIRHNLSLSDPVPTLRDYQHKILNELDARWQKKGSFQELVVLPIGAGKTLIAAEFIRRRLEESNKALRILWVAHTLELAEQAIVPVLKQVSQLRERPRIVIRIGKVQSGNVDDLKSHESVLAFSTVQSISKLRERLHFRNRFDLIVVDEGHHYSHKQSWWHEIKEAGKRKCFLGLTATPDRLDGRELLFKCLHDGGITFRSLVEQGVLACPKYQLVETNDLITELEPFSRKTALRYFETQGVKYFNQPTRNQMIAKHLAQQEDLGPTLVFCATNSHVEDLAKALTCAGFRSEEVVPIHSGYDLDKREAALKWFRGGQGKRRILLNCKLYIEGFDMPDIRTVVLARPTLSPTYWVQMIGRGVRKTRSHESFTIIEYVDKYKDPNWDAFRASFYLLDDNGLDKWLKLRNSDPASLKDGKKRITNWNRNTKQLYDSILRRLTLREKAA